MKPESIKRHTEHAATHWSYWKEP